MAHYFAEIILTSSPCIIMGKLLFDFALTHAYGCLHLTTYDCVVCCVNALRHVKLFSLVHAFLYLTVFLIYLYMPCYISHSASHFLQVHALLPLTALVFPVLWKILDAYGVARILVVFSHSVSSDVSCPNFVLLYM